jgi:hypothetical protein
MLRLCLDGFMRPGFLLAVYRSRHTMAENIMPLVTIHTAFNPMDAQLVKSRLEAADFHPIVTHELSALSLEGYAMAAGGILVQVPDTEADDARELIAAKDSE